MTIQTVSFSELDTIRQCGFKWSLAYGERWQTPTVSAALSRGTLFHAVLEEHYKAIQTGEPTKIDVQMCAAKLAVEKPIEAAAFRDEIPLIQWMYDGYIECYEQEDQEWEIVSTELKVEEPLGIGRRSGLEFVLKGRIDLIVKDIGASGVGQKNDGVWILDHKTCSDLPKGKDVDFDDQMAIYAWLLRQKGWKVYGIIYNACRTKKLKTKESPLDERFSRVLTVRGQSELDEIAREALDTVDGVYADMLETRKRPPRSPNSDTCRWKCGYKEACLISRKGRPVKEVLNEMGFEKNPERH